MKLKVGDKVRVITGKDKGASFTYPGLVSQ